MVLERRGRGEWVGGTVSLLHCGGQDGGHFLLVRLHVPLHVRVECRNQKPMHSDQPGNKGDHEEAHFEPVDGAEAAGPGRGGGQSAAAQLNFAGAHPFIRSPTHPLTKPFPTSIQHPLYRIHTPCRVHYAGRFFHSARPHSPTHAWQRPRITYRCSSEAAPEASRRLTAGHIVGGSRQTSR